MSKGKWSEAKKARARAKRWRTRCAAGLKQKARRSRATGRRKERLRGALVVTNDRERCARGEWLSGGVLSIHEETGALRIARCRCKARGCEPCDKARAGKLAARAAPCYGKWGAILLTLTLKGETHSEGPEAALDVLRGAWRTFTDALFRAYPWLRRYPYLAAIEPHKSGVPHIHVVLGYRWFPVRVLQRFWTAAGGGNLDLKGPPRGADTGDETAAKRAVWYALKYVAKASAWAWEMLEHMRQEGIRNVMLSRNIPPYTVNKVPGWRYHYVAQDRLKEVFGLTQASALVLEEGSPFAGPPRQGPVEPSDREAIDEIVERLTR